MGQTYSTMVSKNWMRFDATSMVYSVHPWAILELQDGSWYRKHVSVYPPIEQSIDQYGYVFHGGTNAIHWSSNSMFLAGVHSIDPEGWMSVCNMLLRHDCSSCSSSVICIINIRY